MNSDSLHRQLLCRRVLIFHLILIVADQSPVVNGSSAFFSHAHVLVTGDLNA